MSCSSVFYCNAILINRDYYYYYYNLILYTADFIQNKCCTSRNRHTIRLNIFNYERTLKYKTIDTPKIDNILKIYFDVSTKL